MRDYLKKFLDATDPTGSLKHLAYAVMVLSTISWLSYSIYKKNGEIDGNWMGVYGLFVGAVTTAKIVGKDSDVAKTP